MYVYANISMHVPVCIHVNNMLYGIYGTCYNINIYHFNHVKRKSFKVF